MSEKRGREDAIRIHSTPWPGDDADILNHSPLSGRLSRPRAFSQYGGRGLKRNHCDCQTGLLFVECRTSMWSRRGHILDFVDRLALLNTINVTFRRRTDGLRMHSVCCWTTASGGLRFSWPRFWAWIFVSVFKAWILELFKLEGSINPSH
ncbi:hypothetical protein A0H81_05203 [Grifola frondosa]|uniref:Uncharacterized protein n=1 Tax=Grifola frondosa TaxID=5627 RepID=A0A1C7MDB1_GRIFR|nr:hypothetical protein A0H81_05203 [Grifola frondosa]